LSAFIAHNSFSQKSKKSYQVPRPAFGGLHLGMTADSAEMMFRKIAARRTTLKVDSLTLLESDSVRIFNEPAYMRIELLHGKVRTMVVNFHPSPGASRYLDLRNTLQANLESVFGRGIITHDASVTYRRWENEDGSMEVSFTDKYMRVFMRLGKWN
jgi:hypothetical protein